MEDKWKDFILPLLELCPPEFDFETQKLKKTIDEQLSTFAVRFKAKWGTRSAFVDGLHIDPNDRMIGGIHPLTFVLDEVRLKGGKVVPVTGFERDPPYQAAVKDAIEKDQRGFCLRLSLDDAADDDLDDRVIELLDLLENSLEETHILVDLKAANFQPVSELSKLIVNILRKHTLFAKSRSLTLAGSSFPATMASFKKSISEISRFEWLLYKEVVRLLRPQERRPQFGDFGIAGPDLVVIDMRLVKPAASVRYTIDDKWLVTKGKNVRDNGFAQYKDLCKEIVKSPHYLGKDFSEGSEYIYLCSRGEASTGNLTTWRWVGTNHHMTKVVKDLANFYGS